MELLVKVHLSFLLVSGTYVSASLNYESWEHGTKTLLCPNPCEDINCCECHSKMAWEIGTQEPPTQLLVEYITVDSKTMVISKEEESSSGYELAFHDGLMTSLPSNLCDYSSIVKIDLTNNRIKSLVDNNFECLSSLDTLILKGNQVVAVSNNTFRGMVNLRIVDLSENSIKHLDPGTLSGEDLRITLSDFSFNELTDIDMSNGLTKKAFCEANFQNNEITHITNKLGLAIKDATEYNSGMINLANNLFKSFPDYEELGFPDITQIGKLFGFGFDFRGANLSCDCNMVSFLELSTDVVTNIWRDYFEVTCYSPEILKGQKVVDLVLEKRLELFVCDLGRNDGCPMKCKCMDQPSEARLVVNCTNSGLTRLPDSLPNSKGQNIELNLENNAITEITNVDYLSRVTNLNLANNDLTVIAESAAEMLANATFISLDGNNKLKSLPRVFQQTDPCKFSTDGVVLNCGCDQIWLSTWTDVRQCANMSFNVIYCRVDTDNIVSAQNLDDILNCQDNEERTWLIILLSIVCVFLIVCSVIAFLLRYELHVIYLRLRRRHNKKFQFDVYVSFEEKNTSVNKWVKNKLIPKLSDLNFTTFVPYRDFGFGEIEEEQIFDVLQQTETVVVLLTEPYFQQTGRPRTDIEWKYAWRNYKQDKTRNILLINFDHLNSKDIERKEMKAFYRCGLCFDFIDRKRNLFQNLWKYLGKDHHTMSSAQTKEVCNNARELTIVDIILDELDT